ncbi:methanobactin export MATE transporter MbnM [Jannaschia marina]|uniref:methanobactin export MATE transporter MbnM n=1 Tax=Jannaschia marina TaxID=2741674 RepID=UPI0015C9A993|nr:methanobactin export MATE transporter MbnM [Jannaschia marina]
MAHKTLRAGVLILAGAIAAPAGTEDWSWNLPDFIPPPPVPEDNPMSEAKVDLGRHLFYDGRLSLDGTMACASCHVQSLAFSDGRAVSIGIDGEATRKNAQGLANVGYMPILTWANPHMDSIEFQALVPLFGDDPREMGSGGHDVAIFERLMADPFYADAFPKAFPEREDAQADLFTVTRALAAFQRSLTSFDSPYDRYRHGGDEDAISEAAKRGEQHFFDHRFECYHCHVGTLLTDNLQTATAPWQETGFHNTGLHAILPTRTPGLIEFTGRPEDEGRFRTPSLRNVAVTAPYMHDGSVADLAAAIAHYAQGGRGGHPGTSGLLVGFEITEAETAELIAFLESLTDETFLTDPRHADPWPEDHAARVDRAMP